MGQKLEVQRSLNFSVETRCAVLDTTQTIGDPEISEYMRGITYNFLRNNYSFYKFKIYEHDTVDKILQDIKKNDPLEKKVNLVVVQAYGNVLYDTWKPVEQGWSLFREYCNNEFVDMAKEGKFLVMGHILDDRESKDRWFRLHEQCFVINYKMWKELGEPEFGNYEWGPKETRQAIRSIENVHDSHTPKYLAPGPGQETHKRVGLGWNFINVSLENGLSIPNFSEEVRATKTFLYPEELNEQAEFKSYFRENCANFKRENSNLSGAKADFLQYQQFTVERSPTAVWVLNTESVADVNFVPAKKPLKNLYSVSAGFKTFAFLHHWHPDTVVEDVNINYYDISQNSLDVRKWLHNEWDPRNFDMYLDFLYENYYTKNNGLITIYEDFDFTSPNWSTERERAKTAYENSILRIFNSMEEFYELFERVRNNNFSFTQANMIRDWKPLLNTIQPDEPGYDSVIWSSNYITTRYTTWILSYEERRDVYKKVINDITEINDKIRVHSADWDGSPTRGMRARELNQAYNNMKMAEFLEWRKLRT